MKTILITGGGGFIGSNIAAALSLSPAFRVVICDRFGTGDKWKNLSKHPVEEVINPQDLFMWLENYGASVDTIIHLGTTSSSTEKDVDLLLESNFSLSRVLWLWAAAQGCRFIYGSAAATYGDGAQGFDDDMSDAALAKLRPINGFGWSKHVFDQYVARNVARGEPAPRQWVGLKFFNVYGPNEYHKDSQRSVICQLAPHAIKTGHVKLFKSEHPDYKDGEQKRDFIYVKDCVDVILWMLANPQVSGIFNCGTGQARSFRDLTNALFAAVGKPPQISFIDMPDEVRHKYQYYTQASVERLRAAGYTKAFTSLEDGVKEYVQHYLINPDPYR